MEEKEFERDDITNEMNEEKNEHGSEETPF